MYSTPTLTALNMGKLKPPGANYIWVVGYFFLNFLTVVTISHGIPQMTGTKSLFDISMTHVLTSKIEKSRLTASTSLPWV